MYVRVTTAYARCIYLTGPSASDPPKNEKTALFFSRLRCCNALSPINWPHRRTRGRFKDPESNKSPAVKRLTISLLVHVTSKNLNTCIVQKCGVQPPSFASGHVHQRLCDASADQRSSLANVGSLKPQIVHQQKAKRNVARLFFLVLLFFSSLRCGDSVTFHSNRKTRQTEIERKTIKLLMRWSLETCRMLQLYGAPLHVLRANSVLRPVN